MTTIKAFNEMYTQFLNELTDTFPDDEVIKTALGQSPDRATFDAFMKQNEPWTKQLMAKTDDYFCVQNEFATSLNLCTVWTRPDCTENTKAAIWQFLQTMYMLGTTMSMFPPEMLSMIEAAAENCAKTMTAQGTAGNEQAIMSMMTQMMGGGGGLAGLANLAGLAGPAAAPSKRKARKGSKKI